MQRWIRKKLSPGLSRASGDEETHCFAVGISPYSRNKFLLGPAKPYGPRGVGHVFAWPSLHAAMLDESLATSKLKPIREGYLELELGKNP